VGGRSRGRFATPADFPPHDCSPFRGLHVHRESLGFVHRSSQFGAGTGTVGGEVVVFHLDLGWRAWLCVPPAPYSDAKDANRDFRGFGWEMAHCRYATSADFP
jgi:hypothetical protein